MGKLWSIIEDWRNAMEFPPSYRQIALRMKVSQSTFDTWKSPERMPEARNLFAIHELTSKPFQDVVQAAIDDVALFDEGAARRSHEAFLAGAAEARTRMAREVREGQAYERTLYDAMKLELSEPDESLDAAADDVDLDADEKPGGSDER